MKYYSPLRYPGGKGKLFPYIKNLFEKNNLYKTIYVEPFAGGSSLALSLLMEEYTPEVYINDIDFHIYAFWYNVVHEPDKLIKNILNCKINIETWLKEKNIYSNYKKHSIIDVGFATFFLNRTNRSGILNGGIIGGKNQNSKWNIAARFNKKDLINRIERIALYSDRINVSNYDALHLFDLVEKKQDKYFYFIDPPYFINGKDLYLNFYKKDDHELLCKKIFTLNNKWIVTYDNVPEINNIYRKCKNKIEYSLNYSANTNRKGKELMFFSPKMLIPDFELF